MNVEIANAVEKVAQQALKAGETHIAYILGILCGTIHRGDVEEFAAAVGIFTQEAIFKQTIRQLKEKSVDSAGDANRFSKN